MGVVSATGLRFNGEAMLVNARIGKSQPTTHRSQILFTFRSCPVCTVQPYESNLLTRARCEDKSHRALSLSKPMLFQVAQLHEFDGSAALYDEGDPNATGECLGLNENVLAFDGLLQVVNLKRDVGNGLNQLRHRAAGLEAKPFDIVGMAVDIRDK